jgi:hypothetical protein
LVTKTTPVRGTARKAWRVVASDAGLWIVMGAKGSTAPQPCFFAAGRRMTNVRT